MEEVPNMSKHRCSPDSTEGLRAKTPENIALDHVFPLHLLAKPDAIAKAAIPAGGMPPVS